MSVIVEKNRITGQLEVGKPESGYYTYSEMEYFFQTGPSLLMNLIMDNNDIIVPIFENKKDTELFLNNSISKNIRTTLLTYAKFSWIEVRELDNRIRKLHANSRKWEKYYLHEIEIEENSVAYDVENKNDDIKNEVLHLIEDRMPPYSVKDEEQVSGLMPTREAVLAEVGKWHALEPANEVIHVGLMRLQDSSYREIYSKVFGEEVTGEFTKAMREKIRRRWCSFLNLADDRGIPKKTLEDMVSPR